MTRSDKQKAIAFLEIAILDLMDTWPPARPVDDQDVISHLHQRKHVFVEWMMREPTWMGIVANGIAMDENQVRDCYNNPLGFRDFVAGFLWDYFTGTLLEANFQQDVMDILIKHKFIKQDDDKPER